MESWAIFAWVGTTIVAVAGTWLTAFMTYRGKAGETAVTQWIELVKAVQSENRRYAEKQAQLESRIDSLESEADRWARDFKELDNQNAVLTQTLADVEADKQAQARRHREMIQELTQRIQAEREINASFQRMADENRLLMEHYARSNRKMAKLLTDTYHMNPDELELYIRDQIEIA